MKNFSVALITLVVCVAIVSTALLVWQTKGRMSDCTTRGGVWSMPGQECTYPATLIQSPIPVVPNDAPVAIPTTTTVTIVVPEYLSDYRAKITAYVQEGGKNPVDDIVFVQKQVTVPYTLHTVWAAAEAAAGAIPLGGGPQKASVVYMQVKDGTAYVVLNIDIDGWAGVSVATALVRPIVERTLYEFPEIEKVVWSYIPGDEPN